MATKQKSARHHPKTPGKHLGKGPLRQKSARHVKKISTKGADKNASPKSFAKAKAASSSRKKSKTAELKGKLPAAKKRGRAKVPAGLMQAIMGGMPGNQADGAGAPPQFAMPGMAGLPPGADKMLQVMMKAGPKAKGGRGGGTGGGGAFYD